VQIYHNQAIRCIERWACPTHHEKVLYVSLPYVIQTLSVDWSKVARLESKQLFLVKTGDGNVYRGGLNSRETEAGRPIEIEIAETPVNAHRN